MKNTASLLSLTVSALLLAACGGGGGGNPDVSSTQTAAKGWGTYNLKDDVSESTYTADKYDEDDIGDIPGERYRIHNIVMTINNKKYTADNPTIDISGLPLGLNNLKYQTRLTKPAFPIRLKNMMMNILQQVHCACTNSNIQLSPALTWNDTIQKNTGQFL